MTARIIAIANQKGGVGKTTTAVNLAASLAVLDRRVLLIDLDPQGAVAPCFGIQRSEIKGGMFDVFVHGESLLDFIHSFRNMQLGIVPVNIWSHQEEEAYFLAVRPEILVRALAAVRPHYDYVLLDTPPTIGPLAVASLAASDGLLVPVQCEELAVLTVGKLLRTARKVKQETNPALELEGLVLTMADSRTAMTAEIISKMRRNFGSQVFSTTIPRTVDLARVVAKGEPLLFTQAWSSGAQAHLKLASEFVQRQEQRMAS